MAKGGSGSSKEQACLYGVPPLRIEILDLRFVANNLPRIAATTSRQIKVGEMAGPVETSADRAPLGCAPSGPTLSALRIGHRNRVRTKSLP
jgi:hypothetical protein